MIKSQPFRILAIVGCICLGLICIAGGDAVGEMIYPPPKHVDTRDFVQMGAHAARAPKSVSIAILVSYLIGSAVTSYLAARCAGKPAGRIAGQVLAGLAIVNVITLPHPKWFYIGMAVAFTIGIWGAPELVRSAPPRSTE